MHPLIPSRGTSVWADLPLVILLIGVALAACDISRSDCTLWNTETFFAKATVEDVARCRASGADVSERSELFGKTPLHAAAASSESYAVIAVLANSGADLEARDLGGRTPIHYAAEYNESPEAVTALLDAGADPKARVQNGMTPLHAAAQSSKSSAVITALLDSGANIEARTSGGWTPLHWAAYSGTPAVVQALLNGGANPKAQDKDGNTPWDRARRNKDLKGTDAYWRLKDERE